jgi:hypothetical protein
MAGARIERLMIDAGAMSPADGRRLILLVAAGLADAEIAPAVIPTLRLSIEAGTGGVEVLAGRIVADALRQIRRAP